MAEHGRVRIVASFDGISLPDAVLKCRQCKVDAEGVRVDGKFVTILCPRCGVRIDGDLAHNMFLEQAQYVLVTEQSKTMARRLGLTAGDFVYESGDEPVEPSWPFFLD